MSEFFTHPQTKALHKAVEGLTGKYHRQRVFEDFLTVTICALAGGTMEEQYLEVAGRYSDGEKGSRGIDILAQMFGDLVNAMEETRADILGDYFEGAISYGAHGQFFTPEHLTDMMAQLVGGGEGGTVNDPACGSGRTLLSAAKVNPHRHFVGQDLDLRCVQMTAINLALNGLRGEVIWGDTLANEQRLIYRTGFNGRGFIAEIKPGEHLPPAPVVEPASPAASPKAVTAQLSLFPAV